MGRGGDGEGQVYPGVCGVAGRRPDWAGRDEGRVAVDRVGEGRGEEGKWGNGEMGGGCV